MLSYCAVVVDAAQAIEESSIGETMKFPVTCFRPLDKLEQEV